MSAEDGRCYDKVPKVCEDCRDGTCSHCWAGMCADRCPDFKCNSVGTCDKLSDDERDELEDA